jgi:hypothetical protein
LGGTGSWPFRSFFEQVFASVWRHVEACVPDGTFWAGVLAVELPLYFLSAKRDRQIIDVKSMARSTFLKILGVSISLACLFFFRAFRYLLYPTGDRYYEYEVPSLEFVALFFSIALAAIPFIVLLSAIRASKQSRIKLELQALFLVLGLACFTGLNSETLNWYIPGREDTLNYELPLAVLAIALVTSLKPKFSFDRLIENFQSVVLVFLVFGLFLILQSVLVWARITGEDLSPRAIENADARGTLTNRVVWVIFDEFDYASMMNRPERFEMPAFDRLLRESFVAENAYPPNFWTNQSLPSLLTGQIVSKAEPISPRRLELTLENGATPGSISDVDNIFAKVKQLGGTTGVVGWVHPYPRLFQGSLDYGYWQPSQVLKCETITECMAELAADAFQSLPTANPFVSRKQIRTGALAPDKSLNGQIERSRFLREKALKLAGDERLNFVFLHFSIPHARFIGRDFEPATKGYFEALEAVDEAVQMMREQMEAKGLWDSTTLIISADHWWRFKTEEYLSFMPAEQRNEVMKDKRVPFLVKLANKPERFTYPNQFNTIATYDLVLGILSGELKTGTDLADRIEKLRAERPAEMNYVPEREKIPEGMFKRNAGDFSIGSIDPE